MHGFLSSLPISRLLRQLCGLACSALLVACGSSGGGSTPTPTSTPASLSGTFIDSPVDGLRYTTTSNPGGGFTSGGGHFACQSGDFVTFWIGSKQIGSPQLCSSDAVTAVSVLGASSLTEPQVVNLAQLLMTLGPIVNNVIQIPQPLSAGFNSALVPTFTDPNFDTAVLAALPAGTLLVSNAQAALQLQSSLKMLTVTIINGGSVTSTPTGILNCTAVSGTCSAAFQTGAVVTLTATGNGFSGWSGGTGSVSCTGAGTCASSLNADSSVTATFSVAPPPATLSISNAGTGTGQVSCSVNGGAFGACAPSYPNGTALILQGVAAAGSTFTGWNLGTGNISCIGINNCVVNLTADSAVTANFTLPVQVSVTGTPATSNGGGGTVQCSPNGGAAGPCASYPVGTPISIIPTPNSASNFTGWTNGTGSVPANCSSAAGPCTFTLTTPTSITANFNRPTLTVVLNGTGSVSSNPIGINTCTTICSAPFDKGAVTLTASGSGFTGWSGGGCSGTSTCQVTPNTDMTVTAGFGGGVGSLTVTNAPASIGDTFVADARAQAVGGVGTQLTVAWAAAGLSATHFEHVTVGFDEVTGQVTGVGFESIDLSVPSSQMGWGCGGLIPSLFACAGASVNTATNTLTLVNTVLENRQGTSPPITLNGSLTFTPRSAVLSIISSSLLPAGRVGTAYGTTLAAVGGRLPLSWSVISGTLPAGLTLNSLPNLFDGQISGTPTTQGISTFTIRVQDSRTPQQSAEKSFSLTINGVSSGGGTLTVANAPARVGGMFVADPRGTITTVQETITTLYWIDGYGEAMLISIENVTGQVLSVIFQSNGSGVSTGWGCGTVITTGCTGTSVNRTAGTVTLANTVLTDGSLSNPLPPITLNGTLNFTPF